MAELDNGQPFAAGWYADYTGEQRMRWWDGAQWTEHVSATGPQAYSSAPARNTVPATTPAVTPFFWTIVILPIINVALSFGVDYRSILLASVTRPADPLAIYGTPGYIAAVLGGWAILIATVILAYFDFRRVKATGFDRPFPWAWAFLSPVYIIGRTVVVRRRSGRGLPPLLVWIAIYLVSLVISIVQVAAASSVVLDTVQGGLSNT